MATIRKVAAAAGLIAAIAAFTAPFEGLRTTAYPDPADPKIATICYGETQGVKFGDTKTPAECLEMLKKSIKEYLAEVDQLLPGLPDGRRIAYADAAYNMGAGIITRRECAKTIDTKEGKRCVAFVAGTSIADLERAGKWQDACRRLLVFDRAGGKQLPGLTKRRQAEYRQCMGETKT